MVAKATRTVAVADDPEEQSKGKKPDYTLLMRQQPQRGGDGKLYRSSNMSVIGSAWRTEKTDPDTGETVEYIGIKVHLPIQVGEDGLLLRTYRENVKA